VKWQPVESSYLFAASYYDGCVKLWDTRSNTLPLASNDCHDGKVLCIDWGRSHHNNNNNSGSSEKLECNKVYSGGSDCYVKATSTTTNTY
jgi:WD40 repeat protein